MKLLKLMFGKMDPNVINAATRRDRGEMQLSLKYEEVRELLLVKVIRATNLDPMDLRAKSADPYVKVRCLMEIYGENHDVLLYVHLCMF